MEVVILEMSPVGACIPEEHPVVGRVLPKAECEGVVVAVGRVVSNAVCEGVAKAAPVDLVCVCAGDAVWHGVERGVWDGGAVAAL